LQMSIVEMQGGLRGSGSDFSDKLGEAADNLNRMVERAGKSFEESSGQSRDALVAVVTSLRETLERANGEMDRNLGAAASSASEKLEAAMGIVLGKLNGQVGQIGDSVGAFQGAMGQQADALTARLRETLDVALEQAKQQFADLSASMRSIEGALTSQKVALEAASAEVRRTSEAFGESATSVRMASAPLLAIGERFTGATDKLAVSVDGTLATLNGAKEEMERLAVGLATTNEQAGAFWASFTTKFEGVDTALGQSVGKLSEATVQQQQLLTDYVKKVDEGLATAIGKLTPLLTDLGDSAGMLADSVNLVRPREPAE
jgi:chromosome segregation ATPase